MNTNSINFTPDLIKGFCEESGVNEALMKKLYDFYSKELTNRISKDPSAIEVPIKNLGIFFMPLHGVSIITSKKKKFVELYGEENQAALDFYEERKKYIKKRIAKCKDCGVKNIRFLQTLISKDYIKNE